jgi:hypothetical protein
VEIFRVKSQWKNFCFAPAVGFSALTLTQFLTTSCGGRNEEPQASSGTQATGKPLGGQVNVESNEYVTSEVGEQIVVATARPFPKLVLDDGTFVPLPPSPTPWPPDAAYQVVLKYCVDCHGDFRHKEVLLANKEKGINAIENPSAPRPMPKPGTKYNPNGMFRNSTEGQLLLEFLKAN